MKTKLTYLLSITMILALVGCSKKIPQNVSLSESESHNILSESQTSESWIDVYSDSDSKEESTSEEETSSSKESSTEEETVESIESVESVESIESVESSSEEESIEESTSSEEESIEEYSEPVDDTEGIDANDLSALYNAFSHIENNYTLESHSFFNKQGAYDYYRHYQKNYVQDKIGIFTPEDMYYYPLLNNYLDIMNMGLLNYNNNLYRYSLKGDTVEERLSSTLTNEDLTLVEEDNVYQDYFYVLDDFDEDYFTDHSFRRISSNKYESTDTSIFNDFINLVCYSLDNTGYYMTFKRVTIELNPLEGYSMRIRLYASSTQSGKLIESHLDEENKPNWYLLFSEALISNVGTTEFSPTNSFFND